LVFGCRESCAFACVFALAADRTFGGVVHRHPYRRFPAAAILPWSVRASHVA
jgi:hypothetical protein